MKQVIKRGIDKKNQDQNGQNYILSFLVLLKGHN